MSAVLAASQRCVGDTISGVFRHASRECSGGKRFGLLIIFVIVGLVEMGVTVLAGHKLRFVYHERMYSACSLTN